MIIYIRCQVSVSFDMELNTIDHIVVTGFASDLVTLLSTVASVMWNVTVLHKYQRNNNYFLEFLFFYSLFGFLRRGPSPLTNSVGCNNKKCSYIVLIKTLNLRLLFLLQCTLYFDCWPYRSWLLLRCLPLYLLLFP